MKPLTLASILIAGTILLSGCSLMHVNSDNYDNSQVPTAVLSAAAGQQQSQVGGYCWIWTEFIVLSTGVCTGGLGTVTPPNPLQVEPAEPLEINLPAGEGHANVEICWIFQSDKPKLPVNQSSLTWKQELKDCRSFKNVEHIKLLSPELPGYYAISMFAAWGEGKDAAHGFMLLVEPQH